jgi:hypothetical protein
MLLQYLYKTCKEEDASGHIAITDGEGQKTGLKEGEAEGHKISSNFRYPTELLKTYT